MEFSQNLIAIIDDLCQKIGIVLDWSSENILPYLKTLVERFIKFEIGTSIFHLAFAPAITILFWIITSVFVKKAEKDEWDFSYCYMPYIAVVLIIISVLFSVATIIVVGCQIYDIIEAIYLPEKTIYDFISYKISSSQIN